MKITYFQNEQGSYTIDIDGMPCYYVNSVRAAKESIKLIKEAISVSWNDALYNARKFVESKNIPENITKESLICLMATFLTEILGQNEKV